MFRSAHLSSLHVAAAARLARAHRLGPEATRVHRTTGSADRTMHVGAHLGAMTRSSNFLLPSDTEWAALVADRLDIASAGSVQWAANVPALVRDFWSGLEAQETARAAIALKADRHLFVVDAERVAEACHVGASFCSGERLFLPWRRSCETDEKENEKIFFRSHVMS